jgi:hypothetical protein
MNRLATRGAVVALILLSLLAAGQSRRLAERRRAGLPAAYAGYSADAPPALTFVIAGLGGFRGIAAEILWLRADTLQEEGRYLELVQLADWITRLDPHASEAWVYNAWNLAYNVSSMMIRPEDRLRWVWNGLSLLRDEGLRYNPREPRLYRELAWLYQNKIGDDLDSAHVYYKLALAETMAPLLRPDGTLHDTPENRSRLAALRLDAARMIALESRFGPLDWRVAESHAVYWAGPGVELATGGERMLCRRGFYQPLILCVFRGRFTGSLEQRQWQTASNLALAAPAADYLLETLAENPSRNLRLIVLRYLALATQHSARSGLDGQARDLFARLGGHLPPGQKAPAFSDVIKGWEPDDE